MSRTVDKPVLGHQTFVRRHIQNIRRKTPKETNCVFWQIKKSTVAPRPDKPMNSRKEQSSSESDSQKSEDYVPPSAPIARKRGRFAQLRAAMPLPAPSLDECRRVNLAKAPNVHQKDGPYPTVPPTVSPTLPPEMPPTMMPTVINRQVTDAVEQAVAPPAPESSNARWVFICTTKCQPPICFGHSGYVAFLIAIFLFLWLNGASASPIPLWYYMAPEHAPILDWAVLWHPWERAILLSWYQFVIVAYKVLPPKTSSVTFLCGSAYNSTEIAAPE